MEGNHVQSMKKIVTASPSMIQMSFITSKKKTNPLRGSWFIYRGEKEIGESTHDGDSLCYDIRFIYSSEECDFLAEFGDAQDGVDQLLTAYEDRLLHGSKKGA